MTIRFKNRPKIIKIDGLFFGACKYISTRCILFRFLQILTNIRLGQITIEGKCYINDAKNSEVRRRHVYSGAVVLLCRCYGWNWYALHDGGSSGITGCPHQYVVSGLECHSSGSVVCV